MSHGLPVGLSLGMSTSWNAAGATDGKKIVAQIKGLGFDTVEVEYRVSLDALRDIAESVREGHLRVLSVHNFTPLAPGEQPSSHGGDKLSLVSSDESERSQAVSLTLKSLGVAGDLGAKALILHMGEVGLGREYHRELVEVVRAEGVVSANAQRIRQDIMRRRKAQRQPCLEAAVRSLREILSSLDDIRQGDGAFTICVENRYYYHQIPLAHEMLEMKRIIRSPRLAYWHDMGHAHVHEVLGFSSHVESVGLLKNHLFGMHVHDSRFVEDHKAPGTGEIDFRNVFASTVKPFVKVLELAPGVSEGEILKGVRYLAELGVL